MPTSPTINILKDAIDGNALPTAHLGRLFTDHVREIMYRETGLPPCDEVNLHVIESHILSAYRIMVSFPDQKPGETTTVELDVSKAEWLSAGNSLDTQLHMFELAIVKISQRWMKM